MQNVSIDTRQIKPATSEDYRYGRLKVGETHSFFFIGGAIAVCLATLLFGAPELAVSTQAYLVALFVFFAGAPHGAFDVIVAQRMMQKGDRRGGLLLFHAVYLLLAAIFVLIWIAMPAFALASFLALSAFHFSGDWRDTLGPAERLAITGAVLPAPALFHGEAVAEIFVILAGEDARPLVSLMKYLAIILLPIAAGVTVSVVKKNPFSAAEIAATIFLALTAPPLLFFIVYFCGLHSIRHICHAINAGRRAVTPRALTAVAIYTGVAALLTLPLGLLASRAGLENFLTAQVFIALAALSVPHVLLVEAAHAHGALQSERV